VSNQRTADDCRQDEVTKEESRRHGRRPCYEGTHFMTRKRLHEGVIKNISKGGTYIEAEGFFFAGQEITVAGPFEDDGQEIKQKGAIVRFDGKGIGVKFTKPGT
jgi:PilZ domain